ncbi:MAG: dihydropteroate synthase [Clostridiaceae bacterium]|nr:dihydropteroate synthase [Eubacteriales bacterium]NLB44052.1 dihydropteroate synthase [Clostridiaceae bacterium]
MILIAENLNSSIPAVQKALADWDEKALIDLVMRLNSSPADYLDVNAGMFQEHEAEVLSRLVALVRAHSQKPLVLDSPDPAVLARVCPNAGFGLLLNSMTLEKTRCETMLDLAMEHQAGLIALLMPADHFPRDLDERLQAAEQILDAAARKGLPADRLFLDPMIQPVSTDDKAGRNAYLAIRTLRRRFPEGVHLVAGLSNISYGLPARRYLNRAFLLQAMACGLDSAILNTLDTELMALCQAGLVLAGEDEYCQNYLETFRPQ